MASNKKSSAKFSSDKMTRIAVVDPMKCKPKNCGQPCKKYCPIQHMGKECISVTPTSKFAEISETLCNGCGICVKKCPYGAIQIINLPTNLTKNTVHRYGPNSFKLHGLPQPKFGTVLGLVGANGIGKSTAAKLLCGKPMPNLGEFQTVMKPQHLDQVSTALSGKVVREILELKKEVSEEEYQRIIHALELGHLLEREITQLSGGELQRLYLGVVYVQNYDTLILDEPSSYLDIRQRLRMAKLVRSRLDFESSVVVIEHDLSILDYLSDYICSFYGATGAYGVVTLPSSVKEGINNYLDGYLPKDNMRFRSYALDFTVKNATEADSEETSGSASGTSFPYASTVIQRDGFQLTVTAGQVTTSQVTVLLGENGTGKSTLIKHLAEHVKVSDAEDEDEEYKKEGENKALSVSMKPQELPAEYHEIDKNVRDFLLERIGGQAVHPVFLADVIRPLGVDKLMSNKVCELSGGEMQRLALVICLGTPADMYLIDEPSAYLDVEQRLAASKAIKREIYKHKRCAFIVEHDFMMANYLADRVIVFSGQPGIQTEASSPKSPTDGINEFLRHLDVSFTRDARTGRPRVNKPGSVRDRDQKKDGVYFNRQ